MRWSVVALVVLLAGCTGSPVEDVRDAAALEVRSPPPADTDDFVDEEPTVVVDNVTPGMLAASLAASALNGSAPLSVDFTLAGLNLAEAAVAWNLDVVLVAGNLTNATDLQLANSTGQYNGTTLPANVTHNFTLVGLFNATLTVVQGDANSTVTLQINVTAGGPVAIPETYTFTGTATGLSEPAATGMRLAGENVEHSFDVFGPVTSMTVTLAWEVGAPVVTDLDLYVDDATGARRGSSACGNSGAVPDPLGFFPCPRGNDESVTIPLTMADTGTWKAIISPFEGQNTEYTLTVTFA